MIAHVALLRRMPRRIDHLDYLVPEGLSVERGDLVRVPFRSASIRGVVLSSDAGGLSSRAMAGGVGSVLRSVDCVEQKRWISETDLSQFEATAKHLIQSISTLLHEVAGAQSAKSIQATKVQQIQVRRSEIATMQQAVDLVKRSDQCFLQAADFVQMAAMVEAIKMALPGPHRVFVPHHHDLVFIADAVTRTGALKLGAAPAIDIVVRSSVAEHASYDRNPRYDTRKLLRGKKIVFIDVLPRVVDLACFPSLLSAPALRAGAVEVVDLADQKKAGFADLLSAPLIKAMTQTLQGGKSILLSYNRKGVFGRLICRACGYQPRCQKCGGLPTVYEKTLACHHCGTDGAIITACPKCGSSKLFRRGAGNQHTEKRLRALFPKVDIVRIEKNGKLLSPADPCIILATRYYLDAVLHPLSAPPFGLVASLLGDLGLSDPTFDATERTLHHLLEWRGVAYRAQCPFLVQTNDAPLMRSMLADPIAFLQEERRVREQAHFPPYGEIFRFSVRGQADLNSIEQLLRDQLAGLRIRRHQERSKSILEIYAPLGAGSLRSALKQLPDEVIIEVLS